MRNGARRVRHYVNVRWPGLKLKCECDKFPFPLVADELQILAFRIFPSLSASSVTRDRPRSRFSRLISAHTHRCRIHTKIIVDIDVDDSFFPRRLFTFGPNGPNLSRHRVPSNGDLSHFDTRHHARLDLTFLPEIPLSSRRHDVSPCISTCLGKLKSRNGSTTLAFRHKMRLVTKDSR